MAEKNGELLKVLRPKFELAGYSVQTDGETLVVFLMCKNVSKKDIKRILRENVAKYTSRVIIVEIVARYSYVSIREI